MGMDIWVHVVNKNGEYVKKDLFDGRNTTWFYKINDEEDEYEYVPWIYDYNQDFVPSNVKENFNSKEYTGYFGFKAVTVKDLLTWYDKYRPDLDAGWIRKFDKWQLTVKGIAPETVYHYFDNDMNINDWEWTEYIPKIDDCMEVIIKKLHDKDIKNDDYVILYFDR